MPALFKSARAIGRKSVETRGVVPDMTGTSIRPWYAAAPDGERWKAPNLVVTLRPTYGWA